MFTRNLNKTVSSIWIVQFHSVLLLFHARARAHTCKQYTFTATWSYSIRKERKKCFQSYSWTRLLCVSFGENKRQTSHSQRVLKICTHSWCCCCRCCVLIRSLWKSFSYMRVNVFVFFCCSTTTIAYSAAAAAAVAFSQSDMRSHTEWLFSHLTFYWSHTTMMLTLHCFLFKLSTSTTTTSKTVFT